MDMPSSVCSAGPPAGVLVVAHSPPRTIPGGVYGTLTQADRGHARPPHSAELTRTRKSYNKALYQCLPDPEADAGASMQLPYLCENRHTMSDWKAYLRSGGFRGQTTEGRFLRGASPSNTFKAPTYHSRNSDCRMSGFGLKKGANRWASYDQSNQSTCSMDGNKLLCGSCDGYGFGCTNIRRHKHAFQLQENAWLLTDSLKADTAASGTLAYPQTILQGAHQHGQPWQAEPVLRGLPRSTRTEDFMKPTISGTDLLAASTGAEALRLLQDSQRCKTVLSRKGSRKGQAQQPNETSPLQAQCRRFAHDNILMMNRLDTTRRRRCPFFWLDLVGQHTADNIH